MKHVCFELILSVHVCGVILSPWFTMPTEVSLGDTKFNGICGYNNNSDKIITIGDGCTMRRKSKVITYVFGDIMWDDNDLRDYETGVDGQSYDIYNNIIYYWNDCHSANSDQIYTFGLSNEIRLQLTTLPINIDEDPCIAIDKNEGLLYVIGGEINMIKVNITQIYNIGADSWINDSMARELNYPRSRLSCKWSPYNDYIYAIAGENNNGITDVIEVYSKRTNTWNVSSVTLNVARVDFIVIFGEGNYNHLLFIIGGQGNKRTEIFNIKTNEIVFGPEFEYDKRGACVIIRHDILYVIGSDPNMNWFSSNITLMSPNLFPTQHPSKDTLGPSNLPSKYPSNIPTRHPSNNPTIYPLNTPSALTTQPTQLLQPLFNTTTFIPTDSPLMITNTPTIYPSIPSLEPSFNRSKSNTNLFISVAISLSVLVIISLLLIATFIWKSKKSNKWKINVTSNEKTMESINKSLPNTQNDKMICKIWQANQFDIKKLTKGEINMQDLTPKNDINHDMEGQTDVTIVYKNDELIADEYDKNQQEIHEFTKGKLTENQWKTQK